MACFRPFLFLFGIVFYLFSLLIIISILLTNVDKAINSHNFCGAQCGFVLAYPKIFNPVDTLLTILAKVRNLAMMIMLMIICSISHLIMLFCWLVLFISSLQLFLEFSKLELDFCGLM